MTTDAMEIGSRRPPLWRTIAEAVALISPAARPSIELLRAAAPGGDGHAVLVLPGLWRGDPHTREMRQFLTSVGYAAHGWALGVNIGPTKQLLEGIAGRLIALSDQHGALSIVGFSMGGLFARWLSLQMPGRVRQVITVCSPIQQPAQNFWIPLEPLLGLWPGVDLRKLADEVAQPLPVPGTFMWSRDDGLVNCAACRDPHAPPEDNIEFSGHHVLMVQNPQVLKVVAQRLARNITEQILH
jgi:pimeloyl-ACP methyl ester carboxylesterase